MVRDALKLNKGTAITEDRERIVHTLNEQYLLSCILLLENRINLRDAQKLTSYVTSMRVLLADLEQIEDCLGKYGRTIASARNLKERFWELEGMAKEVRNSLDREGDAAC
jgi:hypothetical protein